MTVPAPSALTFQDILNLAARGHTLDAATAEAAFGLIIDGKADDIRIAGLLMALRARGETPDELLGAVRAVRSRMLPVDNAPEGTIDVCGTGGDGHGTLNISTSVAFVLAALGIPVAKHGNRAVSSRSGASDVLEALGVPLSTDAASSLKNAHIAFLAAPAHHPAMRHAANARKTLGVRTLFNLIGPLCNPARVTRQMTGVADPALLDPIITVLHALGSECVWAACGLPHTDVTGPTTGIDEITLAGPTEIRTLEHGRMASFELTPDMAGMKAAPLSAIAGGGPEENAAELEALLRGSHGPYRDTVLLNAACALHVAGAADVLRNGQPDPAALRQAAARAGTVLDNGQALNVLNALRTGAASARTPE
ncbi:anthranilate phosphoribosyltransferase [Acetobacter sp. AN02]|uniref:anthranilate phosphoribosyltransferase n=1 Tax=Acetobacter sp. AN02 TaxID=2894186 RepID=UPI0024345C37|nr:anthranilate phosphoribosyltransferase [Acetobacter sp. AN02]MDG6093690.1 anthranilate phosphoribosyltransferase [Acetobacter sp. AN02]